jgi:hypothetical protein
MGNEQTLKTEKSKFLAKLQGFDTIATPAHWNLATAYLDLIIGQASAFTAHECMTQEQPTDLFLYLRKKSKIDDNRQLTDHLARIIAWAKTDDGLKELGIVLTPEVLIAEKLKKRNGKPYSPNGIRRAFTKN